MEFFKQFDNGIKLVVNQMPSLLSVSMGILVHIGAAAETDSEDGISHFIEHMQFKGTSKRTAFQISDEMDRIGAQMNAFTSKDLTCYYAKSTTAHAEEAFDILADLFLNSIYPEDELKREKGVIIEEINMNEDTPDDLCLDLLSHAFFGERGYGRNILGPRENVSGFTKNDINNYKNKYYVPGNIVISMAGNINTNIAEELVNKYFGNLRNSPCNKPRIAVELQARSLDTTNDIEQVHIGIAYPGLKRYEEKNDASRIMNAILGGGMSSRLFQKVREELGLAYTVYSFMSAYAETGSLALYAGVNAVRYEESVEAILNCIEDIKQKNISEEEFIRGKEQLISSQIFAQESSSSQMLLYGKELLYRGKVYNFKERIDQISAVTLNDVLDAVDVNFNGEKRAMSIVGAVDKPLSL